MQDEYPEENKLKKIEEWDYKDFNGLMEYVKELWKYDNCGYWNQDCGSYRISTGGWSGNEDIIEALMKNTMFWMMCWYSSKRGGHYKFEIKQLSKEQTNGKDS